MTSHAQPGRLVSAVVPTYNHERYVGEALRSLANQTWPHMELVVVDDGSADATFERIQNLLPELQERFVRVVVEQQAHRGAAAAISRALSLAASDFIYLLDSDDVALPHAVERLHPFLADRDVALAVGDNEYIAADGRPHAYYRAGETITTLVAWHTTGRPDFDIGRDFGTYRSLIGGNYIPNGWLFRRSAVAAVGGYRQDLALDDWPLLLRLAKRFRIVFAGEVLARYRVHAGNAHRHLREELLLDTARVLLEEREAAEAGGAAREWREHVIRTFGAVAPQQPDRAGQAGPPAGSLGLRIHVYALCWNDVRMLPFFFRHYDPLVERYVIFDDGSTDGSLELLRAHPRVEIRPFVRTNPDSFVLSELAHYDHCWKESRGRADWVIVTDVDEHLYHPNLASYLLWCRDQGVTVIPALGCEMVSDTFPRATECLRDTRTLGVPDATMSKLQLFSPDAVREIRYAPGGHTADPIGRIVLPPADELQLLHYKLLGCEYALARHRELQPRLTLVDLENGWGRQWGASGAELGAVIASCARQARDVRTLTAADFGTPWWSHFERAKLPALQPPPRTAVCTIVAKNYLHFARTLMASMTEVHPDWEQFVLLADRNDGYFDAAQEPFRVVEIADLDIPDAKKVLFRYTILELNTAVKPWLFRALFDKGFDRVLYLDPDIFVYAPLDEVMHAWDAGAMAVLTPHLTGRIRDERRPGERDILLSGAYNLGFLALARQPDLDSLLEYWCEKSLRDFVSDVRAGLFTDQRWMDLVPGMFAGVHVLRHEGYNVAYWNLPQRHVVREAGRFTVNGAPLVFFHFSGLDPARPEGFSKHQNRYALGDVGDAAEVVRTYCRAVASNDREGCARWPYAFDTLDDGSRITPELRRLYNDSPELAALAGDDPFTLTAEILNGSCDGQPPPVTWHMRALHHARADLQAAFPDPLGRDREAFCRWFDENRGAAQALPKTARRAGEAVRRAPGPNPVLPPPEILSPRFLEEAARKALRAAREGRLDWSPRRWVQLLHLQAAEQARQRAADTAVVATREDVSAPFGLNIVGYLSDGTGMTQSACGGAAVCSAANIPFRLLDARPLQPEPGGYRVNLLFVNADQTPVACDMLGRAFFDGRYTIGFWSWELEELPASQVSSFDRVDEVWAPSQFVMRAVADEAPVPVVLMPHPVAASPRPDACRAQFDLREDEFVFLMMYDALSITERKNPLGAIDAFARAFPNPAGVRLVVKVNHASACPEELQRVRERAAAPGVTLVERPFERREVFDLAAVCDAYVSLHRSEGFGLNIAESMYLAKPVIATNWSGNVDFMDRHNSCPVDYALVAIDRDYGPYRKGSRWAEPDLDHAAHYMRALVADPSRCRAVGERAALTMRRDYSPAAIGERYRRRLAAIDRFARISSRVTVQ